MSECERLCVVLTDRRVYMCVGVVASLAIDAGRVGNDARFINHSCAPNCETQKWHVSDTADTTAFQSSLTSLYIFVCVCAYIHVCIYI